MPVRRLSERHAMDIGPVIQLAIYSGRIDTENIPDGIHSAYETLSGQRIEKSTLKSILDGKADLPILYRYALRAIAKVDINLTAKFYSLMKRMLEQAA